MTKREVVEKWQKPTPGLNYEEYEEKHFEERLTEDTWNIFSSFLEDTKKSHGEIFVSDVHQELRNYTPYAVMDVLYKKEHSNELPQKDGVFIPQDNKKMKTEQPDKIVAPPNFNKAIEQKDSDKNDSGSKF